MSLHRSLKTKSGALEAHRNVLSRPERIAKLKEDGRFDDESSPIGLPKVRNIKLATGKKKAEDKEEGAEEAAAPAAGAATKAAAPKAGGAKK